MFLSPVIDFLKEAFDTSGDPEKAKIMGQMLQNNASTVWSEPDIYPASYTDKQSSIPEQNEVRPL